MAHLALEGRTCQPSQKIPGHLVTHAPSCCLQGSQRLSVARSCLTLCDPTDCSPPGSSVNALSRQEYWSELPFPLQVIFQTHGLNLGLLHCREAVYHLWHQELLPTGLRTALHSLWGLVLPQSMDYLPLNKDINLDTKLYYFLSLVTTHRHFLYIQAIKSFHQFLSLLNV